MTELTRINGGCHCGNIEYQYEVESSIDKLSIRACTCSFCSMQGAIYTSDPSGCLTVNIKSNDDLQRYQFSSKQLDFIFCGKCGVMPLVVTDINDQTYILINIRTANKELLKLPVQMIDFTDETREESIKRRESKWIPYVKGI